MACPSCGGSIRRSLDAGVFVCATPVTRMVPEYGPPSRGVLRPVGELCGSRYVEVRCYVCGDTTTHPGDSEGRQGLLCPACAPGEAKRQRQDELAAARWRAERTVSCTATDLRRMIDRQRVDPFIRWVDLPGAELASLVPDAAWRPTIVGQVGRGRRTELVRTSGLTYYVAEAPAAADGRTLHEFQLLPDGSRVHVVTRLARRRPIVEEVRRAAPTAPFLGWQVCLVLRLVRPDLRWGDPVGDWTQLSDEAWEACVP
jgi:hypothetical protein